MKTVWNLFIEKMFNILKFHQKKRFYMLFWWNVDRFDDKIKNINLVKFPESGENSDTWWNIQGLVKPDEIWKIGKNLVKFLNLSEIRAIFSTSGIFWNLVKTRWRPNKFAKTGESLVKFPQFRWTWQKIERNVLLFRPLWKTNQDPNWFGQNASLFPVSDR